jgi:LmbE family N-acetylglucosaminyl deacetylase
MAKILVISPHALDEVLGCGGVLAAATERGDMATTVIVFGDGTGHDGKRRKAAEEAAALLGCTNPQFLGMPENRGDAVALSDVIGPLESAISKVKPDMVYVPHGGSLHVDHRSTYRAAVTALRPLPGSRVQAIYGYEILSSTDWAPACDLESFVPCRYEEITAQLQIKMAAIDLYAFDMRPPPHARSAEAVRRLAEMRGSTVGLSASEAFTVVREIKRYSDQK